MGRKIWRLSKFEGGLNSYTDPKDIKASEFADLVDVDVSKIGVIRPIGGPVPDVNFRGMDSSPVTLELASGIMPGNGLYGYSSDVTYSIRGTWASWAHSFSLNDEFLGGSQSTATFGIKTLLWGTTNAQWAGNNGGHGDATDATNYRVRLTVGGVPITNYISVFNGAAAAYITDQNWLGLANDPLTSANNKLHYSSQDATVGGDWSELFPFAPNPPYGTGVIHQVCNKWPPTGFDPFTPWGANDGMEGCPPMYSPGWAFWGHGEAGYNTNLNDPNLPLDARYNASGDVIGTNSIRSNKGTIGFYHWAGYEEDTNHEGGNPPSVNFSRGYTRIYNPYLVPEGDEGVPHGQNYKKARLSFLGVLCNEINAYAGTSELNYKDKFNAKFVNERTGGRTYTDYQNASTYEPLDDIVISSWSSSDIGGNIGFDFLGGTFQPYPLTSSHVRGPIGVVGNDPGGPDNNSAVGLIVDDYLVADADQNGNGAAVITGDTSVVAGTASTAQHQQLVVIRGNPQSSYTLTVRMMAGLKGYQFIDNHDFDWGQPYVIMDEQEINFDTNMDVIDSLVLAIENHDVVGDVDWALATYSREAFNTYLEDLGDNNPFTPDNGLYEWDYDEFEPAFLVIVSPYGGEAGEFGVYTQASPVFREFTTGQNTEDENLAFIHMTNNPINDSYLLKYYQLGFKLYSKQSDTWLDDFSVSSNGSGSNSGSNTNYNEVFPWFKFFTTENHTDEDITINFGYLGGHNDPRLSNPVFWNEGNSLRIAESNFILLKGLREVIRDAEIEDDTVEYNLQEPRRMVEENPNMWVGWLDLQKQFLNAAQTEYVWANQNPGQSSLQTFGHFITKADRKWRWSINYEDSCEGIPGLVNATSVPVNSIGTSGAPHYDDTKVKYDDSTYTHPGNTVDNWGEESCSMQFYMYKGTYSEEEIAAGEGGLDWSGSIKVYAAALYHDNQESLPGHFFSQNLVSANNYFGAPEEGNTLKLQVLFRPSTAYKRCFDDPRVVGIKLYYTHSEEAYENLWELATFHFEEGFISPTLYRTLDNDYGNEGVYRWGPVSSASDISPHAFLDTDTLTVLNGSVSTIEFLEMPKSSRYEDNNLFAPTNNTISVQYRAVTQAGRRTFVGNLRIWDGNKYIYKNDSMICSPVNKLDTFPYPDNVLDFDVNDGDEIVALDSLGDIVIQFKQRTVYFMNISTGVDSDFYIEEKHRWKGIRHRNHKCRTSDGVFWYNANGAWLYDGSEVKDIFNSEDGDEKQKRMSNSDWDYYAGDTSICGYHPESQQIIIIKNSTYLNKDDDLPTASSDTRGQTTEGDFLVYDVKTDAWSKGKKKFYLRYSNLDSNGHVMPMPNKNQTTSMTNVINWGDSGQFEYLCEENAINNQVGNEESSS